MLALRPGSNASAQPSSFSPSTDNHQLFSVHSCMHLIKMQNIHTGEKKIQLNCNVKVRNLKVCSESYMPYTSQVTLHAQIMHTAMCQKCINTHCLQLNDCNCFTEVRFGCDGAPQIYESTAICGFLQKKKKKIKELKY